MSHGPVKTLSSGYQIPLVGFGTWQAEKGLVGAATKAALEAGVRHIDCAQVYGNEIEVGEAFAEVFGSGKVQRKDVFITSKLWNTCHEPERVRPALMRTLKELQLDYLDLYLIHWPLAWEFTGHDLANCEPKDEKGRPKFSRATLIDTWRAMETLVDEGLVRSIGVSNFNVQTLIDLCNGARIQPAVNQIEVNPLNTRPELIEVCDMKNVHVTCYSAFGSAGAGILSKDTIVNIAKKYNKTPAQVVVRWCVDQGHSVIPKSTHPERVRENFNVLDFQLAPEDISAINAMNQNLWCLSYQKPFYGYNPFA